MLKPRIDDVKEVVRIWNKILQPLDTGIGNAVTYRRLIEFQTKKEDWTIWYDAKITSFQENSTRYTNYDLVWFVFDAGNIIANEIVNNDEEIKKEEESGKTKAKQTVKAKPSDNVKPPEQLWRGTIEQKARLFNELVSHSLVVGTPKNKSSFLMGSPVQWLGTFVLLIFLIDRLKPKYINSFAYLQNIIDKNFIGEDNEPFGSTRQPKYNMGNNRKEPKGAEIIKAIIDSLQ